jgi:hypothetical protein
MASVPGFLPSKHAALYFPSECSPFRETQLETRVKREPMFKPRREIVFDFLLKVSKYEKALQKLRNELLSQAVVLFQLL